MNTFNSDAAFGSIPRHDLVLNLGIHHIDGATTNHDYCKDIFCKEEFRVAGKKTTYPEIQDNFFQTNETLTAISRGTKTINVIPGLLAPYGQHGILAEVENIKNVHGEFKENIFKWQKINKTKEGENDVTYALAQLFSGKNATLFHSLKTGQYLHMIWDKNRQITRKRNPKNGLSDLELKLSKVLKIDPFLKNAMSSVDQIRQQLLQLEDSSTEKEMRSRIKQIKPSNLGLLIFELLSLKEITNIGQTSDKAKVLLSMDNGELESLVKIAILTTKRKENDIEIDNLIFLPKHKLILQMETKTLSESANILTLKNNIIKADNQTFVVNKWIENVHGDILGKDFRYIRCIALPNQRRVAIEALQIDCSSRDFILTKDELETHKNMKIWWKNIKSQLNQPFNSHENMDPSISPINHLIGRLFLHSNAAENWNLTKLENAQRVHNDLVGFSSLSAGLSSEGLDCTILDSNSLDDVKKYPIGSIPNWIFWNPIQAALLEDQPTKVAFISDAGQGKTLLLKHLARKLSLKGSFVSYESFSSFNQFWIPRGLPSLVDLAAKEEFNEFNLKEQPEHPIQIVGVKEFKSAKMILPELTLFTFISDMVKKYPEQNFFFDEVTTGVGRNEMKIFESFLKKLIEESAEDQFVWIAVKIDQTDDKVNGGNASSLENLKTSLRQAGWTVPDLVNNMRNSAVTTKIANQIKTPIGSEQKGKPFTTVHGFSPLLLKVGKNNHNKLDSRGVKKAMKEAVEHLGLNLRNDLLTIIVNEKSVSDCICELAKSMKWPLFKYIEFETSHCSMFGKEEDEKKEAEAKRFLRDPNQKGIILTDINMFSGMETRDVVLIMGPGNEMRDSMMRSTSRFVLITINGKGEGWLGKCYGEFTVGGDYSEQDYSDSLEHNQKRQRI